MHADHSIAQIIAQVLIALPYVGLGVINVTTRYKENIARLNFFGMPLPRAVIWIGVALQVPAGLMLMFDYRADIAAAVLIVFTVVATAIFHRIQLGTDGPSRHMHISSVLANLGLIGALSLFV